jgi:hypothetical protein
MPSLNLLAVPGRFAVCKFLPKEKPPAWIFDEDFYSITRTEEELSVVCRADKVPDSDAVSCESGWVGLKVQGPLDFSLTGILDSLTRPLAEAGISIFALSTYNTDYLLVRETKLNDAVCVLTAAGHNVQSIAEDQK